MRGQIGSGGDREMGGGVYTCVGDARVGIFLEETSEIEFNSEEQFSLKGQLLIFPPASPHPRSPAPSHPPTLLPSYPPTLERPNTSKP